MQDAKAKLAGVYQAWKADKVGIGALVDAVAEFLEPAEPAQEPPAPALCGVMPPAYALEGALKGCTGCKLPAGHSGRSHQDSSDQHDWLLWEEDQDCTCCKPGDHDHCVSFLHIPNEVDPVRKK